jgi:hypothetical protein
VEKKRAASDYRWSLPIGGLDFEVFQRPVRGIVLDIQAEERSCENKGGVYFMKLAFEKVVQPGAVVGVRFTFPSSIPNGNRCMDVVDLIYG